tara:strand:+ start:28967 stop:30259 length:1293 start_codon:yes stop_codon:yes gene_type:complete
MSLDDIVSITITKESTAIDTASFSIPLLLTSTAVFSERTRTYTSLAAVGEEFDSTTDVYAVASGLFGGSSTKPASIVVGRQQVDEIDYTFPVVETGDVFTITVSGTTYNYTAIVSDTDVEVAEGLKAAFDLDPVAGITFTEATGVVTVGPTVQGADWSITTSANVIQDTVTTTEAWGDTIAAIEQENTVWYGVVATTHEEADALEIAEAIQARRKIFGTSTQNAVAITTAETDIIAQLEAFNYDRTYAVYTPFADEDYPEAVWMGSQLPLTPGSNTWNFKQGPGVRAAKLSDTQKVNLRNKNGNMFTTRAGVDIFEDGVMVDGSWIDEIIVVDWLYARWQEAVFFRLINSRKVPFTRTGATIIQNEILAVCALGVANGAIADDTPHIVTAPDPLRIPPNQRASRNMGDFKVSLRLAGAVHKVRIDAIISV